MNYNSITEKDIHIIDDKGDVILDTCLDCISEITCWKYHTAPIPLQQLSIAGGDEDWIFIIDKEFYDNNYIQFLENLEINIFQVDDYYIIISDH